MPSENEPPVEKQGAWYLGGVVDPESGRRGEAVQYESSRFTTHGVIVGMTGSGKTGLGIIALEEALMDGIPCLVIDPKGNMGNLLLNFPDFLPEDFRPWIDEGQAKREDVTPDELAANTADLWKNGLAGWGSARSVSASSETTRVFPPTHPARTPAYR